MIKIAGVVNVIDIIYKTKRKMCKSLKKSTFILFGSVLPKWNYWAVPQNAVAQVGAMPGFVFNRLAGSLP
jgi:hypothetical protein